MINCGSPAEADALGLTACRTSDSRSFVGCPFDCFSVDPFSNGCSMISDEGALCSGAACFRRAIAMSDRSVAVDMSGGYRRDAALPPGHAASHSKLPQTKVPWAFTATVQGGVFSEVVNTAYPTFILTYSVLVLQTAMWPDPQLSFFWLRQLDRNWLRCIGCSEGQQQQPSLIYHTLDRYSR